MLGRSVAAFWLHRPGGREIQGRSRCGSVCAVQCSAVQVQVQVQQVAIDGDGQTLSPRPEKLPAAAVRASPLPAPVTCPAITRGPWSVALHPRLTTTHGRPQILWEDNANTTLPSIVPARQANNAVHRPGPPTPVDCLLPATLSALVNHAALHIRWHSRAAVCVHAARLAARSARVASPWLLYLS